MRKFIEAMALSVGLVVLATLGATSDVMAEDLAAGSFKGASGHVTSGDVAIVTGLEGAQVQLRPNFRFDGAPDPKVGFGRDGKFDPATILAPLQKNSGEQHYAIPGNIDAGTYNEVYVWCQKYNVPLGVAKIR